MPGIGTVINVTAIICGGLLGLNFGHFWPLAQGPVACGLDAEKSKFLSDNDLLTGIRNRNYYQHEINNFCKPLKRALLMSSATSMACTKPTTSLAMKPGTGC